jgi:hypothetical protein
MHDVFTARDKLFCIRCEIAYRERLYPRFLKDGLTKRAFFDMQISILEEIAEDYRKLAEIDDMLQT